MESRSNITGVILAGGAGRRVGHRDKGLIPFRGKPLVAHVCENLEPQVGSMIVSCNRNLETYGAFAPRVVVDRRKAFQGPLSGIESVAPHVDSDYLAIVGCDMPDLPADWVRRLVDALARAAGGSTRICYAHDGERDQYLCAVLKRECLASLKGFLDGGRRAVKEWYGLEGGETVDFSDQRDRFINYNRLR